MENGPLLKELVNSINSEVPYQPVVDAKLESEILTLTGLNHTEKYRVYRIEN